MNNLFLAIAIVNVTLIDGGGGPPRRNATVVIENDSIVAVGDRTTAVPEGATVIDGTNRFLIPGLFDSHIHLSKFGEGSLKLCIANGVTSVRDMGSDLDEVHAWRSEIESGTRVGPRIRTSGPMLESAANMQRMLDEHVVEPVAAYRSPVATPADAAKTVASLKQRGVDYIKVRTIASKAAYFAIGDAARKAGLPLVGHAYSLTPAELLKAGQRSIEHYLPANLLPTDEGARRAQFRELARAGVVLVPTLIVGPESLFVPSSRAEAITNDSAGAIEPRRRYVSEHLQRDWREQLAERRADEPRDWDNFAKTAYRIDREMHEEGMRLLAGTDTGVLLIYPGFAVHDELQQLVGALGLTPSQALLAATSNPAEFLGDTDAGVIAEGKRADLVVLDADPLEDIANTKKIAAVIARGRHYDRAALDRMLAEVAEDAASFAISGVTVIDMSTGQTHERMNVTVRGNRIVGVSRDVPAKNVRVVDGRGKFVIPGLWDLHVHLSWTRDSALPILIASGVTSVRDLGSHLEEIDAWRAKIDAGVLTGPRIVRVGPILNGKKFNAYQLVPGNPDETRGAARALKEVGVDAIKIHRRFPRDSYFALIDEAKKLGLPVVGHIPMTVSPEEASDAGQATIDHTDTLFEGTFAAGMGEQPLPDAIRKFRANGADALFATFVANGTVVTPTLIAVQTVIDMLNGKLLADPRRRYIARSLLAEAEQLVSAAKPEDLGE
jgi:imidazolonepropionase-like amidohydrolase